jgi:putative transposase
MVSYMDDNKARFGVESICKVLPIAPSTYYDHKAKQRQPDKRSSRAKRDEVLTADIQRIWEKNFRVYGVRKVCHQLKREDRAVATCSAKSDRPLSYGRSGPCSVVSGPDQGVHPDRE